MNWKPIIVALEKFTAENAGGIKLVPDNVADTKRPGVPHLVLVHVPVDTSPRTIGRSGVMDTEGVYVIGLNYPAGEGSGAALAKADELAALFRPGLSITAGSGNIVIQKATLGYKQPTAKPDWFTIPLVVHYNAFHPF